MARSVEDLVVRAAAKAVAEAVAVALAVASSGRWSGVVVCLFHLSLGRQVLTKSPPCPKNHYALRTTNYRTARDLLCAKQTRMAQGSPATPPAHLAPP